MGCRRVLCASLHGVQVGSSVRFVIRYPEGSIWSALSRVNEQINGKNSEMMGLLQNLIHTGIAKITTTKLA